MSELAKALAAAQAEMKNAPLNKVNPHFRSRYADLAAIRDATLPILNRHGLSITQTTEIGETGPLLRTTLRFGAETVESVWPLPNLLDKPQAMGSALTYGRRYCWAAICGVSSEEDDDANAAQDAGKEVKPSGKAPPEMEKITVAIPERPALIPVPVGDGDDMAGAWKAWSVAMNSAIHLARSVEEVAAWLDNNADPLRNLSNFGVIGKKLESRLREVAHAKMEALEKEAT